MKRYVPLLIAAPILLADVPTPEPLTDTSPLWYAAIVPLAILVFALNQYLARRRRQKGTFR